VDARARPIRPGNANIERFSGSPYRQNDFEAEDGTVSELRPVHVPSGRPESGEIVGYGPGMTTGIDADIFDGGYPGGEYPADGYTADGYPADRFQVDSYQEDQVDGYRVDPRSLGGSGCSTMSRPTVMARVLLCEPHAIYRIGLRAILDSTPDLAVIGESAHDSEACTVAHRWKPQVILVAHDLPDMGGLEFVRQFATTPTSVIVLGDSAREEDVIETLRAGANGYLLKNTAPHQLIDAVRSAARGETVLDSSVAGHLIPYLHQPATRRVAGEAPCFSQLTRRQRDVALLVAEGLSNSEIAAKLCLTTATVKSHLRVALRTLGLRDRTQLAILAHRVDHGADRPIGVRHPA
jgi:DNA-binding NarL/FixJ family response regulator